MEITGAPRAGGVQRELDSKLLVAVLMHQHAILADGSGWTKIVLARTRTNQPVLPLSDHAWSWSLSGALALALAEVIGRRAAQTDWQRLYDRAVDALWNALPDDQPRTRIKGRDLDGFNDFGGTDVQDIQMLIERALSQLGVNLVSTIVSVED